MPPFAYWTPIADIWARLNYLMSNQRLPCRNSARRYSSAMAASKLADSPAGGAGRPIPVRPRSVLRIVMLSDPPQAAARMSCASSPLAIGYVAVSEVNVPYVHSWFTWFNTSRVAFVEMTRGSGAPFHVSARYAVAIETENDCLFCWNIRLLRRPIIASAVALYTSDAGSSAASDAAPTFCPRSMRDRARPTHARLSRLASLAAVAAAMALVNRTSAESNICASESDRPTLIAPLQKPSPIVQSPLLE